MRPRSGRPPSKLEPFKDYLLARLAEFPELSVDRPLRGDPGAGLRRRHLHPQGLHPALPRPPPGAGGPLRDPARATRPRCDWAHLGTHELSGEPTPLYLFVMVLGFSRALYAEVVTSDRPRDLPRAATCAPSQAFGGMPEEILYDNQKQVVLAAAAGRPGFHPEFLAFAGHYGFRPRLCRPYRAQTKGKVERSIGYLKDRFFCGRTFTGLADLNAQLETWLATVANEREHATTGEKPGRSAAPGGAPARSPPPGPGRCPPPVPAPRAPALSLRLPEVRSAASLRLRGGGRVNLELERIALTAERLHLPMLADVACPSWPRRPPSASRATPSFWSGSSRKRREAADRRATEMMLATWPRFPFRRTLEDFDFAFQPSVSRKQVRELASCAFVERRENVIFLGPPGVGKTPSGRGPGPRSRQAAPAR